MATPFLQAKVAEIGARRVDVACRPFATLGADGAERVHLVEERRQILGLRDRDLVAQLEEEGGHRRGPRHVGPCSRARGRLRGRS